MPRGKEISYELIEVVVAACQDYQTISKLFGGHSWKTPQHDPVLEKLTFQDDVTQ